MHFFSAQSYFINNSAKLIKAKMLHVYKRGEVEQLLPPIGRLWDSFTADSAYRHPPDLPWRNESLAVHTFFTRVLRVGLELGGPSCRDIVKECYRGDRKVRCIQNQMCQNNVHSMKCGAMKCLEGTGIQVFFSKVR